VALVAGVTALATAAPARASNLDLFGYGARGAAMGGAIVSTAEGHEAVYYNPGGLAFDDKLSFAIGYQRGDFQLKLNGEDVNVTPAPSLVLGFGVPIPLGGILKDRVALGLGFVLPRTSVLVADIPRPGEPRFVLLGSRAQTVSLQSAFAFRVFDWLGLGVGFLALAELEGAIDVAPNESGRIGAQVRDSIVADYSPVFGVQVRPTRRMAFGFLARGESTANFNVPITVELGDSFNIPVPELAVQGTAQYDPRQFALEGSWRPQEGASVGFGVVYKQWSRFENPIGFAAVPEGYPAQPLPEFEDTVVLRLGAEWTFPVGPVALTPRGGLVYEPSPVPEQTAFHNYLDNDRVISSLGLGVRWENLTLDLVGQLHLMPDRRSDKVEGTSEENPAAPSIEHGGSVVFTGAEVGVDF